MEKTELEKQADIYLGVMPKMTVMQPVVVNMDNTGVATENVSRKRLFLEDEISHGAYYDTEQGEILPKMDDVDIDYSREDGK